jgi:hypothetical protein
MDDIHQQAARLAKQTFPPSPSKWERLRQNWPAAEPKRERIRNAHTACLARRALIGRIFQ